MFENSKRKTLPFDLQPNLNTVDLILEIYIVQKIVTTKVTTLNNLK